LQHCKLLEKPGKPEKGEDRQRRKNVPPLSEN
jgi:hypothetical protein